MFDVGFLELAVILVLGLLVLGPERLPKTAQTIGYWFGKARRYVEGMKSQVESEFDSTELKRLLHNQDVQIRELQNKLTDSADMITKEIHHNSYPDDSTESESESAQSKASPAEYDIIEEDDGSWGNENIIEPSSPEDNTKTPLDKAQ